MTDSPDAPHIPVLLTPLLAGVAPISGCWADATLGAGGYARGLLQAGASQVIGIDRDPLAISMAEEWGRDFPGFRAVQGTFSQLDELAGPDLDGVVMDLGVSSMQLDLAERGFSFLRDGPLDMRMEQDGPSAADLVNEGEEALLADILYQYGEERASRRIAKAIVKARKAAPIETTAALAEIVADCLPRPKPGQSHPATRSFQALRIAVNDEFGQLAAGLEAAERALKPGGALAVVTFHSLEDRVVKRFLQARSGRMGRANRYAPEIQADAPAFTMISNRAIGPDETELTANPRARSAKLRLARRSDASSSPFDRSQIGLPPLTLKERS
ncbi:MAG: 16S rRNA (cytosine(1402)-N(4))-methyltransferase RsmH [Mangrovicoccus sp.]